ncbi:uncharacterized protein G2W53_021718 [Senna tora]|uniref:Uncharacterized protein n=1 Tax=Senna tora TaxID=362788 RepID=A0A834TTB1_9FABA|nr:uncharacterized protein G2W53_021718 [Senna tora]
MIQVEIEEEVFLSLILWIEAASPSCNDLGESREMADTGSDGKMTTVMIDCSSRSQLVLLSMEFPCLFFRLKSASINNRSS